MNHFGHIRWGAASDMGRKRKNNEDAFGAFPEAGVFCVADGMGGGDDGEVASAATVRAVEMFTADHPQPDGAAWDMPAYTTGMIQALNTASEWIFTRARERSLKGCGSTFVGMCLDAAHPADAMALHAGDSRLYRIRGRNIQQITRDHSAAELIGAKKESDINPMFRGMILRAVGISPAVEVEQTPLSLKEGDRILICSDGLSKMVPDKTIASISRSNSNPNDAANALIAAANEAGGVDNITAVLVDIGEMPAALPVKNLDISDASERTTADALLSDAATSDTQKGGFSSVSGFVPGSFTIDTQHISSMDLEPRAEMLIPEEGATTGDTEDSFPGQDEVVQSTNRVENALPANSGSRIRQAIVSTSLILAAAVMVFGAFMCIRLTAASRRAVEEEQAKRLAKEKEVAEQEERRLEEESARLEAERKAAEEALRAAEAHREEELCRHAAEQARKQEIERKAEETRKLEEIRLLAVRKAQEIGRAHV